MKVKSAIESKTISVYTEPYTKFVIQRLIGIKGKSESDVVNFILKTWIEEHSDHLEKCDITVKKAKEKGILGEDHV